MASPFLCVQSLSSFAHTIDSTRRHTIQTKQLKQRLEDHITKTLAEKVHRTTLKMSHTNIDKKPSTPSSFLQEPRQAHLDHRNTFLPTYEEHLNDALRNFSSPRSQFNLKSFDHIEEPKRGRRQCMKREYLIIAIVLLLICAIALPIGLVYILHRASTEHEVGQSLFQTTKSSMKLTLLCLSSHRPCKPAKPNHRSATPPSRQLHSRQQSFR